MKKRTKKQWILIIVFGFVMWVVSQVWLYLGKEGVQKVVSESNTKMTQEERVNAIKICSDEGLSEVMCTCIINKTADEFTLAEMGKMNQDMKEDGMSLEADMIVRECASELNIPITPRVN